MMLHRMNAHYCEPVPVSCEQRVNEPRDQEKDMVKAIELFCEFKRNLAKLDPICTEMITRIVSERHF